MGMMPAAFMALACRAYTAFFAACSAVRDKDGVSAAAAFGEMAGALAREGQSCAGALRGLFERYGAICCNNGYLVVRDARVTEAIFSRLQAGGRYWARARRLGKLAAELKALIGTTAAAAPQGAGAA